LKNRSVGKGGFMNTETAREWIRKWIAPALLAILIVLTGCTKTQQVLIREPATSQETLEGRWDLVSFGPVLSENPVLAEHPVFIVLADDGKVSGSGGCNRYFGGWGYLEGAKDTLRIWGTGSTRMACPESVMTQEHRFLEEITRVSRYRIDGKELRLFYDEGRGILRFARGVLP
jgi:heat shock protein HslJ